MLRSLTRFNNIILYKIVRAHTPRTYYYKIIYNNNIIVRAFSGQFYAHNNTIISLIKMKYIVITIINIIIVDYYAVTTMVLSVV